MQAKIFTCIAILAAVNLSFAWRFEWKYGTTKAPKYCWPTLHDSWLGKIVTPNHYLDFSDWCQEKGIGSKCCITLTHEQPGIHRKSKPWSEADVNDASNLIRRQAANYTGTDDQFESGVWRVFEETGPAPPAQVIASWANIINKEKADERQMKKSRGFLDYFFYHESEGGAYRVRFRNMKKVRAMGLEDENGVKIDDRKIEDRV